MRRTRQVIPAHVLRQRDVFLGRSADPRHGHLQRKDFCAAKRFHNLRTGLGPLAAIQDTAVGQVPNLVGILAPPLRAFAAHLVQLEHAVGLPPTRIVGDAPPGDERPSTFVYDATGFVLVHAEVNEVTGEVPRLRDATDDRPLDAAGHRIGRAEIVGRRVAEERLHVAERRGAGSQDVGVFYGVDELIEFGWIETIFQADVNREHSHCSGRRKSASRAAKLPVAVRYGRAFGDHARDGFVQDRLQRGPGIVVDVNGKVRNRIAHHVQRLPRQAAAVDDAAHDIAGDAGGHRRLDIMVGEHRRCARRDVGRQAAHVRRESRRHRVVPLPAAEQL